MSLFRKFVNVSLAALLLLATTGITLNKHYCMGRLKSVAIFHNADICGENGDMDPMPCCEDVSEQLKVENLTKTTFDFRGSPELYQLAIINFILLEVHPDFNKKDKVEFRNYSPPPLDPDIPVLIQSFLI